MKISKLFHWLYAILMLLPFGLLIFNALSSMWSGSTITLQSWTVYINGFFNNGDIFSNLSAEVFNVYDYLIGNLFGFDLIDSVVIIECLLTYWTCISIIWLVFDVFMYVPLLVHRWIDKAKLE